MNNSVDQRHLAAALLYALLGLVLGIFMAASHNHGQAVTHAHLLLVGFLLSFAYAVIGRLWLGGEGGLLRQCQFWGHHLGVVGLVVGLFLLYGGSRPLAVLEPLLAGSSILVLLALALMTVLVWRAERSPGSDVLPNIAGA